MPASELTNQSRRLRLSVAPRPACTTQRRLSVSSSPHFRGIIATLQRNRLRPLSARDAQVYRPIVGGGRLRKAKGAGELGGHARWAERSGEMDRLAIYIEALRALAMQREGNRLAEQQIDNFVRTEAADPP